MVSGNSVKSPADSSLRESSRIKNCFLTYETEFVPFLAVLENSVLPMG